jgi:hypothetical protein
MSCLEESLSITLISFDRLKNKENIFKTEMKGGNKEVNGIEERTFMVNVRVMEDIHIVSY